MSLFLYLIQWRRSAAVFLFSTQLWKYVLVGARFDEIFLFTLKFTDILCILIKPFQKYIIKNYKKLSFKYTVRSKKKIKLGCDQKFVKILIIRC
jgi:hypothetical protein